MALLQGEGPIAGSLLYVEQDTASEGDSIAGDVPGTGSEQALHHQCSQDDFELEMAGASLPTGKQQSQGLLCLSNSWNPTIAYWLLRS